MEPTLLADIAAAEQKANDAALPPILRGWLSPHAAEDWQHLEGVAVKREIIREVLDIRLLPNEPGNNTFGIHRLQLRWLWQEQPGT